MTDLKFTSGKYGTANKHKHFGRKSGSVLNVKDPDHCFLRLFGR